MRLSRPVVTIAFALLGSAGAIADDTKGREILDRRLPGLTSHPSYEGFKQMTLPQLAPNSEGQITAEQIKQVEADLVALHPSPK